MLTIHGPPRVWRPGSDLSVTITGDVPHGLYLPTSCRAVFYRDAARGDLLGYLRHLSALLSHHGVIVRGRVLASFDGSRLARDADNPRTEVVLSPVTPWQSTSV